MRLKSEVDAELIDAEADIAKDRERFLQTVSTLRRELATAAKLRYWVREHPLPVLGGALLLGFWVGWRWGRAE
jgi:hypothetical protein